MTASFWQTFATYCNHLAPVTGPLLQATGNAAAALHNAECEAIEQEQKNAYLDSIGRRHLPESIN